MYGQNAPALIDCLTSNGQALPVFTLVDVGVSGGIYPIWRKWGDKLHAVGFDPSTHEVEVLRKEETNPGVIYECSGCADKRRAASVGRHPLCPRSLFAAHALDRMHA